MSYSPFGSIPMVRKGRTKFPESHSVAGTFPLSKVCPVFFTDTLPGTVWDVNVFNVTKLETLIAPAMQQVDASILWFKMPKRLVFKHYKKWYTGGETGEYSRDKPHIRLMNFFVWLNNQHWAEEDNDDFLMDFFGPGSLWSYLGLPCPLVYRDATGVWTVRHLNEIDTANYDPQYTQIDDFIDLMPFMAYNYIYDCFFRDQTLSEPVFVEAEEGDFRINRPLIWTSSEGNNYYFGPADKVPEGITFEGEYVTDGQDLSEGSSINAASFICLLSLFTRAWRKDYFTSALPSPQRGPEVSLKFIDQDHADVIFDGEKSLKLTIGDGTTPINPTLDYLGTEKVGDMVVENIAGDYQSVAISPDYSGAKIDLSGLSPISIAAFRNLFKLQAYLERNNVAGGRYIESILAHWGERVPDFTVQRPQFVRATSLPVQISEVTATANSSGVNSLVGDQAGRARTQGNLGRVHIYTQEPSFIFGLYCVTAPPSYVGQGIPKMFQRRTRYDEPWPEFQHIGEQAIKLRELYFPFEDATRINEDFGYQQRFSEFKYMPNRVVGDFQTSLSYWHMARMFKDIPALNDDFVTQHLDPRIFAVQNSRPVTADFFFQATCKQHLSKYSTPKIS